MLRKLACALVALVALAVPAGAADPIKIGFSMALTGGVAPNGKQILAAFEIWRDDVNAKGGLLGRPVQLVYYDDQSSPANVPALYTKLLDVDKVDLLIGPYATNMVAPAMPVIMAHNKMTISILGLGVNREFKYGRYFSTVPTGPEGPPAFSKGFFELAKAQNPAPKTVAIVAADAEFAQVAASGARVNAKAAGFDIVYEGKYPPNTTDFLAVMRAVQATNADIVYEGKYPPNTTDFLAVMRAVQATNADIVFAAAYPPDTVGIVRAANEIGLVPKMFGGSMIGLTATPIKMQLGALTNGIVINESFQPALDFPGTADMMRKYQAKAPELRIDPLGYGFAPFAYAAGQLVAKAVEETKSLDDGKLAAYLHGHTVDTVIGPLAFGADGEWTKSRMLFTQFQGVTGNGLDQFKDPKREVILWPAEYKKGELIYPYGAARK
jgi:branched-chain amino acid transport system substrate-binding protein